jgi:hypothetical protein
MDSMMATVTALGNSLEATLVFIFARCESLLVLVVTTCINHSGRGRSNTCASKKAVTKDFYFSTHDVM